mgnify:CR=1 FL=1
MKRVNIRDKQFGGGEQFCFYEKKNKYIEWVFNNELVSKTCWFTDLCFTDVLKCRPGVIKRKVAWTLEPRAIYPYTYDWISANNKLFDFVVTYDKELLDRGENFLWYQPCSCWIHNFNNEKKTKMCSTFASPKRHTTGHVMRHNMIAQFKDKMDVFGPDYNYIKLKEEGLCEYRYSVTIENSIQEYYWTEKIADCFATKTIPIYWGCKSVVDYFNPDGILFFNTFDELDKMLNDMSEDQYNSMLPAIEDNFNRIKQYRPTEDYMFKTYPFLFE